MPFNLRHDLPSLDSLGFAVQHFPRYTNPKPRLHAPDVVLLSCILRGRGQHLIDDEAFEERGNSVAVTHYGQRHDIVTHTEMDVINLYLDLERRPLPPLAPELDPILPLFLPLHPRFVHRLNRIVRIEFEDLTPLATTLFAAQRELQAQEPGYAEAAGMWLRLFLMACCRQALSKGLVHPPKASGSRLERLRTFLDLSYAQPHTLQSLARRTRLSRTYLCRAFKAYTGRSVFGYLVERRVQAAMLALRNTDHKVLAIALESGFHDLAYFNRTFRRLVGATPTAYRQQVGRLRQQGDS